VNLIRWTAAFLRPYRARVAVVLGLSLVEIGLVTAAPWALTLIVDSVLGEQPLPAPIVDLLPFVAELSPIALLALFAGVGLLVELSAEVVRMSHTQIEVDMGQRVVHDLRSRLLEHLQALPLRHHLTHRTSDAVYRLDADTYCINDLVTGGALPIALAALHLMVMFVVVLVLDASLALLALAVAPFLFLCLRYHATTLSERAERVKMLESGLVERAYETLRSIAAIKSFARERHEHGRFARTSRDTAQARVNLTWQESLFSLAVTAVTLVGTAVILVVGGIRVVDETLTVGQLLVVIAYLARVYDPVAEIAHTVGNLQQAVVGARRVRDILTLEPEVADAADALDARGLTGHVRFDTVDFSYDGARAVLDGIAFEARPGELVAIVGPTGAGKTTLVHLIPRLFEPTSGHVLIDGRDARAYRLRTLREQIALVPQDPLLFAGTIADNIRYGRLDASDAEVEQAARDAQIHAAIARLPDGYATPIAEAGASLSGGERQRLGIARALLKQAPILILDEPTSAVDTLAEAAVFDSLRRLRDRRTTFVIAHRLSTIRDATCILVLQDGRITARGRHESLLGSSDLYRRMWERLASGGSLDDPDLAGRGDEAPDLAVRTGS
jgi:ABC-type multidrug transport system fused ATPase/permease subunit